MYPKAGLQPASGRWCRNNCKAENLVAVCLECCEHDFWGLHCSMSVGLHKRPYRGRLLVINVRQLTVLNGQHYS